MALSDCSECWETPCVCGWEFKDWSHERHVEFIKSTLKRKPLEEQWEIARDVAVEIMEGE